MSSSSIRSQINSCERELQKLKELKSQYEALLPKLNSIGDKLRQAISKLKEASSNLKQSFKLDGQVADKGATEDTANNVEALYNNLHNKIIPAVQKEIKNLSQQITSMNNRISQLERDYRAAVAAEEERSKAKDKSKTSTTKKTTQKTTTTKTTKTSSSTKKYKK